MAEAHDREFFLSVFLMEAWDTLAAVEDGLATLMLGTSDSSGGPTLNEMAVVTHRLRGAAALNGFPAVARLAAVMEEAVAPLGEQDEDTRRRSLETLSELATGLKEALDGVGDTGQEDAEFIADLLSRHGLAVADETETAASPIGRRLGELDAFFADNPDVLDYFVPEATEHLEAMGLSLLALEREGATTDELARLFRTVHTLKGAAYTVGCRLIGDVAHRVEDLLDEIREERRPLTAAAIEAVFISLDALRLLVRSAHGDTTGRPEALTRALAALDGLTGTAVEAEVESRPEPEPQPEPEPAAAPAERSVEVTVPIAPAPLPVVRRLVVVDGGGPLTPRSPHGEEVARASIRVNLGRLDALMNLVGELVIARSRLERRLGQLDQVGDLLAFTEARMRQAFDQFEKKYLDPTLSRVDGVGVSSPAQSTTAIRREPVPGAPTPGLVDLGNVFGELEFDRYDDFNILARRVGEFAGDVAEIQGQLAGLVRTVREDAGRVQQLSGELRREITRARMVPLSRLFARCGRQVREAARAAGKPVKLEVIGETVEMDNTVIEQISDPLIHLIQNAIVHGIEDADARQCCGKPVHGTIRLAASHRAGAVVVELADDGRGIDVEAVRTAALEGGFVTEASLAQMSERDVLDLIFLPGCSTAPAVTAAAGRGVGMDVVRTNVARLGGEVDVETTSGQGTRFSIRLPLTVAISDALLVRLGSEVFGFPVTAVKAMVRVRPEDIQTVGGRESVEIEGQPVEFLRLEQLLRLPSQHAGDARPVVAVRAGRRTLALAVDELLGKSDVVMKTLGAFLEGVGLFGGATVSGEGRVILLLDPARLADTIAAELPGVHPAAAAPAAPATLAGARRRVLLVDDSVSVRKFVGQMLERAGFAVTTANDGADALQRLADETFEVVVTDLEMPRLNGYDLIRDLKRRPATRQLPIVVLTTRAGDKHVSLARQLGVQHYVPKPVDEQAFVRLLESLAAPVPAGMAV